MGYRVKFAAEGFSDSLAHYGIKGQQWNIRRYQNEDGTLTAEGREHYGVGDGERSYAGPKQPTRGHNGGINPNTEKRKYRPGTMVDGYDANKGIQRPGTKSYSTAGTVLSGIGTTILGIGALRGLAGGSMLKAFGADKATKYMNTAVTVLKGTGAVLLGKRFLAGITGNKDDKKQQG